MGTRALRFVYVIAAEDDDGSDIRHIRAHTTEERAIEDLNLLRGLLRMDILKKRPRMIMVELFGDPSEIKDVNDDESTPAT